MSEVQEIIRIKKPYKIRPNIFSKQVVVFDPFTGYSTKVRVFVPKPEHDQVATNPGKIFPCVQVYTQTPGRKVFFRTDLEGFKILRDLFVNIKPKQIEKAIEFAKQEKEQLLSFIDRIKSMSDQELELIKQQIRDKELEGELITLEDYILESPSSKRSKRPSK